MIYRFGNNTIYGETSEENNLSALTRGISKDIMQWIVFCVCGQISPGLNLARDFPAPDPLLLEQSLSSLGVHRPYKFWLP